MGGNQLTFRAATTWPKLTWAKSQFMLLFWSYCLQFITVNNKIITTTENLATQAGCVPNIYRLILCVPGIPTNFLSKFLVFVESCTFLKRTGPTLLSLLKHSSLLFLWCSLKFKVKNHRNIFTFRLFTQRGCKIELSQSDIYQILTFLESVCFFFYKKLFLSYSINNKKSNKL